MKYHMYNIPILVHQHLHDTVDGCEILHQLVDGKHQIITPMGFTVFDRNTYSFQLVQDGLSMSIGSISGSMFNMLGFYSMSVFPQDFKH